MEQMSSGGSFTLMFLAASVLSRSNGFPELGVHGDLLGFAQPQEFSQILKASPVEKQYFENHYNKTLLILLEHRNKILCGVIIQKYKKLFLDTNYLPSGKESHVEDGVGLGVLGGLEGLGGLGALGGL